MRRMGRIGEDAFWNEGMKRVPASFARGGARRPGFSWDFLCFGGAGLFFFFFFFFFPVLRRHVQERRAVQNRAGTHGQLRVIKAGFGALPIPGTFGHDQQANRICSTMAGQARCNDAAQVARNAIN